MNVQCENCNSHFVLSPGDVSGATACPDCGGTRFYRDQPSPVRSDGDLRDMVDPISQKDQGGNPLGEGTIMGSDGERPAFKRDNYMHSKVAHEVPGPPCPHCKTPTTHYTEANESICPNCGMGVHEPAIENPAHPDPWMDNEPGATTFPAQWANRIAEAQGYGDPMENLACPNCGSPVIADGNPAIANDGIFCTHCNHQWPANRDEGYVPSYELPGRNGWSRHPIPLIDPSLEYMDLGPTHQGKTADAMEEALGLTPENAAPQGNFSGWQPGTKGRGLVIGGEPHTWTVYHPDKVGDESHSGYVGRLGIDPNQVDWQSQVEIHPSGEVEPLISKDVSPYIAADPRLKPLENDMFSDQVMLPSHTHSRTSNTDFYASWEHESDVQFDKGPDQNVAPPHEVTLQPGSMGLHAGQIKYLRFLKAHAGGLNASDPDQASQIFKRFGLRESPEFGQPIQVAVHDPSHLPALIEQIQSGQGAEAVPRMKELAGKIQRGEVPPPPGIDPSRIAPVAPMPAVPPIQELEPQGQEQPADRAASVKTAGPALAIGAEGLLGGGEAAGGAGMLGKFAPSLMAGALFHGGGGSQGSPQQSEPQEQQESAPDLSQLAAVLVSDYETPSSVPDIGTKHDDPEKVDTKEFNDGDKNPNFENPNNEDSGAMGEDAVRDKAGFGPESPGIERMNLMLPLVLHYFNSEESGENDPMLKGLHEVLESESPGYLDKVTPEDEEQAKEFVKQMGHKHEVHAKTALVPPMQPGGMMQEGFQPGQPVMPGVMSPPGGSPTPGHCPNCGGVLTADGSCPQCGAKQNPMGGANMPGGGAPLSGGPSMPMSPMLGHTDVLAALVDSANHQGPVTPEQIAAVQQYLIKHDRVQEVPNVPLEPGNYAREMAEIQQQPNVVPQVQPGEQTQPPAPMGQAPGGMPMPGMGGGESGGQPMQPMAAITAADNVASRCPKCHSATTGMLMDEEQHQQCHSCGNIWKAEKVVNDKSVNKETHIAHPEDHHVNPIDEPAAEQNKPRDIENEQDSSLSWQDESGQPLQAGQEYEMHNPSYEIPDVVRVERVKPDGLDIKLIGTDQNDPNTLEASHTVTREEMQMQNLTFSPVQQNADQQNPEPPPGQAAPGLPQVPPSGQTTDEIANSFPAHSNVTSNLDDIAEPPDVDHCPKCGHRHFESSMSSETTIMNSCYNPKCGHVWEVKDEPMGYEAGVSNRDWLNEDSGPGGDDFFAEMERVRAMSASGQASRNLSSIAANDSRLQAVKEHLDHEAVERQEHTAGKKFSPSEQRSLIDEEGTARNADLLNLSGTHYKTRDDYSGKSNGANVPAEHLLLGL